LFIHLLFGLCHEKPASRPTVIHRFQCWSADQPLSDICVWYSSRYGTLYCACEHH